MRKAMLFLQKYGISTTLGVKIYEYYGAKLYQVLEENPYQLADNIDGVGFKTADEIAARIGIHADSDFRIRSGLFYVLQQAVGEGHIYLPQDVLARRAMQILGVEISEVEKYVMDLCIDRKTVMKEENGEIRIYPAHYYYLELNTAEMLHDLDIDCEMPEDMIEKRLKKVGVEREDHVGRTSASGGDRGDQTWPPRAYRRTGNRKDDHDQHDDPVF